MLPVAAGTRGLARRSRLILIVGGIAFTSCFYAFSHSFGCRDALMIPAFAAAACAIGLEWQNLRTDPAVANDAPQRQNSGSNLAMVERVFSGVQPTGNLHLGNYLGAIVKFVGCRRPTTASIASSTCTRSRLGVGARPNWRATPARSPRPSSPAASIRRSTSSSTRARSPSMPSWPGSSIASRGSAG